VPDDASVGEVARCVASPALRCRETVGPLAERAGLEVEELDDLAEGGDPMVALAQLLDSTRLLRDGASFAACTHGDVIDGILETFGPSGVTVTGALRAPKASVWQLTVAGGDLVAARFEPPPELRAPTELRSDW
jgi:8-oxo-dGTP diphosphatase